MLVYRDTTRIVSAKAARIALELALGRMARDRIGDCALMALLRASELECALADLGSPAEPMLARITDAIAAELVGGAGASLHWIPRSLADLRLPQQLRLRTPEGYAFYGLDPRQYGKLAEHFQAPSAPLALIGVRSIGPSLSAVLSEALQARGLRAERISVRPNGHPWERVLHFGPAELAFVQRMREREAEFVVIDEGPGMSGSTLLAVADALEAAGVPASAIRLCCSRSPDSASLIAPRAAERYARYRVHVAPSTGIAEHAEDLSAGAWRHGAYPGDRALWPAIWTQVERVKWRTHDKRWFDKFEGLPPYADAAFDRACTLAQVGYAPPPTWLGMGYVRYPWLEGRPASHADLDASMIAELARYCAFRTRAFPVRSADASELTHMLRTNTEEALECDLTSYPGLEVRVPIVPDARMHPHEWRIGAHKLHKTDGHADGDGHLMPGPTDVCWDLAGAIIEWQMDEAQSKAFVSSYARLSGDPAHQRLDGFLLAYCAARMGEMVMASTSADSAEQPRLRAAYVRYCSALQRELRAQQRYSPRTRPRAA